MRRVGETIHLITLGFWLGALFMTGVTAARVFPVMRDLEPGLGAYPAYTGEHWSLGAGRIAAEVFIFSDGVQFACAFISFATLGLGLMLWLRRSITTVVRTIAVGLCLALVSYYLFMLTPQMIGHLDTYWTAAAAGNNEAAEQAKTAFDAMHPIATKVMGTQAVLVLIALVSGCLSAVGDGARTDAGA